jgi:aminoglycoside/choline kinase family phosphotransferase
VGTDPESAAPTRDRGARPSHAVSRRPICRIDYPRAPARAEPSQGAFPETLPIAHASPIAWSDADRRRRFDAWLGAVSARHGLLPESLRSASSDASFRRYLRVDATDGATFIVMDAPPPHEDVRPFVRIARHFRAGGLHLPEVIEADEGDGFLLLDDLGARLYLDALIDAQARGDAAAADALLRDAIAALVRWQGCGGLELPRYDDALLRRELALFPEWCVAREHGVRWSAAEETMWRTGCDLLVQSALAQATAPVHRDFMPRNLMVCEPNPGILDFQDAVQGPVTYDMACLLRDAFVSWDEEREIDWSTRHWEAARKAGLPVAADFGEHWRALEWMGLQRHLKVLGIFCRLKHRDGKPAYSRDLPRFFAYAHKTATRYAALRPLTRLLEPLMGTTRLEAFY